MSIIDKVIAAVTPPESGQARADARTKARSLAAAGGWLEMVLDHHVKIEQAFAETASATTPAGRLAAQKELAVLLNGHSMAEEATIYPALALHDEKAHAEAAYLEQSMAKIQLAALDDLEPMSQEYLDKLGHIKGAVLHHVYQEEGTWFPDLQKKLDSVAQSRLAMRYQEEVGRYFGTARA